jgi:hypothetical protein
MKSFTTPDFWNSYAVLPPEIKEQARKTYKFWIENPSYPSLHFKKVGKDLWSVRITRNYRALSLKKGEDFYWIWIGTHDQYEILLS